MKFIELREDKYDETADDWHQSFTKLKSDALAAVKEIVKEHIFGDQYDPPIEQSEIRSLRLEKNGYAIIDFIVHNRTPAVNPGVLADEDDDDHASIFKRKSDELKDNPEPAYTKMLHDIFKDLRAEFPERFEFIAYKDDGHSGHFDEIRPLPVAEVLKDTKLPTNTKYRLFFKAPKK